MFNNPYFDRVWTRLATGDATPTEQQDMALRIETIVIQLRQEQAKPKWIHVPPLGHPSETW